MAYLLDTNIIIAFMTTNKKNEKVKQRIDKLRLNREKIFITAVSYYEIKRGFLMSNASRKLNDFSELCKKNFFKVILLNELPIFDAASEIYTNLYNKRKLIGDADILIASMAKTHDMVLVSNDKHFQRIQGLKLENWLDEEQ